MSSHADDALDDLLARPTASGNEELRHTILAKTTRLLRRRRLQRRIAFAAALAAAALLAIASVFNFKHREKPEQPASGEAPMVVQTPTPDLPAADAPAAVIERLGETSAPGERAAIYRRAGDRYLAEAADPQDALRCYTQALDEGSENDLTISADDSWLLMALKMDRKKEKTHANRD